MSAHNIHLTKTKLIILLVIMFSLGNLFYSIQYQENLGYDFRYYYEAGKGNLDYLSGENNMPYVYHPITQIFWKPLNLFSYDTAQILFYFTGVLCWIVLVLLLCKMKYGWILALFSFYPFWLNLTVGNVNSILAVIACHPVGATVAMLFKPYYAVFAILGWAAIAMYKIDIEYWMPATIVYALLAFTFYFTNHSMVLYSEFIADEMFRKMNLIHLLPMAYLIWRLKEKRA